MRRFDCRDTTGTIAALNSNCPKTVLNPSFLILRFRNPASAGFSSRITASIVKRFATARDT